MALCLAVVVIQALGLRGIPSTGQLSSATSNASCSASSASSKSLTVPIRAARMRSASRAKVSDTTCCAVFISCFLTLLEFHNRADLDGTIRSGRNPRGQRNHFVEVFTIHQVIAAELLFRLSKWAIGCQCLSVAYTHSRRGVGGHKGVPAQHRTAFRHFFCIH